MKNVKKNGGFTLVELIVVIAILAILAAVAIPAYSGYIAKAEKANDLQLLGAVNQAFASACVDQNFTQYDVKNALLPINDYGMLGNNQPTLSANPSAPVYVLSLTFVEQGKSVDISAFNAAFALYFSGNETTAFKTFKNGLIYSPETGFVALEDYEGEVTVAYKGTAFTVNSADVQKIADSTYGEIGAEELLGKVDFASGLCVNLVGTKGGALYSVVRTDEYKQSMATAMGFESVGDYNDYVDTLDPDVRNEFYANSLVLTAAQNSSTTINESLLTNLADGKINTNVNSVDAIAETAAVYALYTAYAQDKGLSTDGITGNSALNSALGSDDFKKYASSDKAKEDLEAYLAAMNVVNDATSGNTAGTKDILTNGFTDAELAALMGSLMG